MRQDGLSIARDHTPRFHPLKNATSGCTLFTPVLSPERRKLASLLRKRKGERKSGREKEKEKREREKRGRWGEREGEKGKRRRHTYDADSVERPQRVFVFVSYQH